MPHPAGRSALPTIAGNLTAVRQRIAEAACAAGRDPGSVTLVAVSKLHPAALVREAYAAGQRDFGENYVQELVTKAAELAELTDLRWHLIGHLQRNKARQVAPLAGLVQTVDSARLVDELAVRAAGAGRRLDCLVQVNVGAEEQKSGCAPDEAEGICAAVEAATSLRLRGLMTIPPFDLDPEEARVHFRALAALRERLGGAPRLPELSMGMSGDYDVAIAEGATLVRVGTAIFGSRS